MPADRTLTTTLRLRSLEDLFVAPDILPLAADFDLHSGRPALDYLADEVRANGSCERIAATFELPLDELLAHDTADVRRAVGRWAAARCRQVDQEVAAAEWRGIRMLVAGVVAFIVLIAMTRALERLDGDVADTIRRGVEVGAWVVLWFPLDLLVFERWQHRLDRRAYRLVGDMQIELRARDDSGDAHDSPSP